MLFILNETSSSVEFQPNVYIVLKHNCKTYVIGGWKLSALPCRAIWPNNADQAAKMNIVRTSKNSSMSKLANIKAPTNNF